MYKKEYIDSHYGKLVKDCRTKEGKLVLKDMFTTLKYPMFIAMCVAIFPQLTGINAIIFYSNDIFEKIGTAQTATYCTVGVMFLSIVSSFLCGLFIEKFGRKTLMIFS